MWLRNARKGLDLWGVVFGFIREQEQDLKIRCEDDIISPLRENLADR
jgi:hypothetical protein